MRHAASIALVFSCACGASAPGPTRPPPSSTPSLPALPTALHATRVPGFVLLEWAPAADATSYEIVVSGLLAGNPVTQDVVNTTDTRTLIKFTDSGDDVPLLTFSVQPVGLTNPAATVKVPAPPLPELAAVTHHRVLLTWPFDPIAGHAAVVHRSFGGSEAITLGPSSSESFEDLSFTDGIRYDYSLTFSSAQLDLQSRSVTAWFPAGAPTDVVPAPADGGVVLTWTPGEGESTAQILMSMTAGGPYGLVGGGLTSPTSASCPVATTCYFVLRSQDRYGQTGGTSSEVSSRAQAPAPAPTAHSLVGSVRIDWPVRPPDAESFAVFRSPPNGTPTGDFAEIGRTGDLNYTDAAGLPGISYWYAVQSIGAQGKGGFARANPARSTEPPDQQNLLVGPADLDPIAHDVGQFFTVGVSGQLTGIEISGQSFDEVFPVTLSLFDGATRLAGNVAAWDRGFSSRRPALVPGEVRGVYYDLSPFGISVSAGQTLRFEGTTGPGVTDASIALAEGDAYVHGSALVDGAADASKDLLFKTFVRAGTALSAPSPLEASPGTESVSLRWPASPGAIEYRIGRSDTPGGVKAIVQTTTQTTFVDTGLLPGGTYQYQITAAGQDGSTVSSNEQSAQVLPMVVDEANLAEGADATFVHVFELAFGGTFASQVVTAGRTGTLVGFEVSAVGFQAPLRLRVLDDATGTLIATADYPLILPGKLPRPLSAWLPGPAYLDLTPLGLHIVSGDRLRFQVTAASKAGSDFFILRQDAAGTLAYKTFIR